MNTYTKTLGGWGERLSNPVLRLSGAFSGCRTLRFQGCGFFMTWPGRRNGARAKGVHGKDKETAAGLKSPALRLNRNAFLRRRKLILWVDFRRKDRRPVA